MGRRKGSTNRPKSAESLEKKLINDLEDVFKMNTDKPANEKHLTEHHEYFVAVNEVHTFQYDIEEHNVLYGMNAWVDGIGEDTDIVVILSPRQIEQMYSYLKYRQAEINWNKSNTL